MNETNVKIESTPITPFFELDFRAGIMEFRGRSSPCSSRSFYHPILQRIESAFERGAKSFTANFAFEYFNTSSSKCLMDILKKLATRKLNGENITINWYYEACDDDMKETGEDYADMLGVNFNYIKI